MFCVFCNLKSTQRMSYFWRTISIRITAKFQIDSLNSLIFCHLAQLSYAYLAH